MGKRVTVMRGQTIWDLAIQCYGRVDGVILLLEDNADQLDSLNNDLTAGQQLQVRSAPLDRDVVAYYEDNDLHPVSGELVPLGGAFSQGWDEGFDNQIEPV